MSRNKERHNPLHQFVVDWQMPSEEEYNENEVEPKKENKR